MNKLYHVLGWAILALLMLAILGMIYITAGPAVTLMIVCGSGVFAGLFFLGMWLISR